MPQDVAAKRYAKAFFEIGVEKKSIEKYSGELSGLNELAEGGSLDFLSNPVFSDEEKKRVADELLTKQRASLDFKNFVHLLIEEKRADVIPEIYREFVKHHNEYLGQERATVYSAIELNKAQIESLRKILARIRGKKLLIENVVDATILGGLKIEIGSFLYDGSVRSMLDRFKTVR